MNPMFSSLTDNASAVKRSGLNLLSFSCCLMVCVCFFFWGGAFVFPSPTRFGHLTNVVEILTGIAGAHLQLLDLHNCSGTDS